MGNDQWSETQRKSEQTIQQDGDQMKEVREDTIKVENVQPAQPGVAGSQSTTETTTKETQSSPRTPGGPASKLETGQPK